MSVVALNRPALTTAWSCASVTSLTCESAGVEPVDHLLLHVEAEHPVAGVGQLDRERQPDVAQPDDAEQRLAALGLAIRSCATLMRQNSVALARSITACCCASVSSGYTGSEITSRTPPPLTGRLPLGVAQVGEARLQVQRQRIVDRVADALGLEVRLERIPPRAPGWCTG